MSLHRTLRFIVDHPLNARHKGLAVSRFLRWQVGSRLLPGAVAVPFVDGTVLLAQPGMEGATGNIYCGLHEFPDMSFVLHALRPGDLFVDVGANVGSYTVLAAGACGADVISCEPIPAAYRHLQLNIHINELDDRVRALRVGVGSATGLLRFTSTFDSMNHVVTGAQESQSPTVQVEVTSLDELLEAEDPYLLKIDVEGYETEVVDGASQTLARPNLAAVVMELNGSGGRFGFDESDLHRTMLEFGFDPYTYDPFSRTLLKAATPTYQAGNVLYVRKAESVRTRLRDAPTRTINRVRF